MSVNYIDGYLNQLIDTVMNCINPRILNVYGEYKEILSEGPQKETIIKNRILSVLLDLGLIENTEEKYNTAPLLKDLKEANASQIEAAHKRRRYTTKKIIDTYKKEKELYFAGESIEKSYTPFTSVYLDIVAKTERKNINDVIGEYDEKFNNWVAGIKKKKNKSQGDHLYICDYPFFMFYEIKDIKNFFKVDLIDNLLEIAGTMDFKTYAQFKPDTLRNTGIFRQPGRVDYPITEQLDLDSPEASKYVVMMEEFIDKMEPGSYCLENNTPYLFDDKASRIINYLTTECRKSYYKNAKVGVVSMEVTGTIGDIVHIIWPEVERPGAFHYKKAKSYIQKLTGLTVLEKGETKVGSVGLFESVSTVFRKNNSDEDREQGIERYEADPEYFSVVAGRFLKANILEMACSTIIKTTMDKLDNSVAKLLYQDMKKDRVFEQMNNGNKKGIKHSYSLNSLQLKARVTGRKSVKLKKYADALNNMVDNNVLIESFTKFDDGFIITWLPLSDIEYSDIIRIEPDDTLYLEELEQG